MKPRAGQVSVNPSGLAVVTGTDVQSALAQLDAAASPAAIDERARDAVGAALAAGSGITITVNDPGDTITISSSAGGGGVGWSLVVNEAGTSLANWTTVGGTWAVDAGGYLKQTATTGLYTGLRYSSHVPAGAGLIMQADISVAALGGLDAVRGFVAPVGDGTVTSTRNSMGGIDVGHATIALQRGDQAAYFPADSPAIAANTFYTVRAYVLGDMISVAVNGTLVSAYRYLPLAADTRMDYPMLVAYRGEARFKNIKVWRLDGPA